MKRVILSIAAVLLIAGGLFAGECFTTEQRPSGNIVVKMWFSNSDGSNPQYVTNTQTVNNWEQAGYATNGKQSCCIQ